MLIKYSRKRTARELYKVWLQRTESFCIPFGSDKMSVGLNLVYLVGAILSNNNFDIFDDNREFINETKKLFKNNHIILKTIVER